MMHGNQSRFIAVAVLGATLLLAACASGPGMSSSKAEFEQAYAAAKDSFDRSEAAGHAWTTAEDTLKEASEAATAGDYGKATELAKTAKEHSDLAVQQGAHEAQPDMTIY
jgi:hypothetical protein